MHGPFYICEFTEPGGVPALPILNKIRYQVYVRKQPVDQYILSDASFNGLSFLADSLIIILGESLMIREVSGQKVRLAPGITLLVWQVQP